MNPKHLLAKAIAFDGGPPVMVNGHIWDPSWRDADRYNFKIEKRDTNAWAVIDLGYVLTKDLEWIYEPMPSARDEAFYRVARFSSPIAAMKALDQWRSRERKRLGLLAD